MDSTTGTTTTWTVDPNHTDVAFSVRHMGLSTVRGRFGTVSGAIDVAADGRPVRVSIDIDVATIATGSADRDGHLVSADFFDAANHPTATFVSRDVRHLDGDRYEVEGDLTMHGITKPVVLDAEIGAPITDPWGLRRRAATATATIDRTKWGLTWNQILEMGALLVAEQVKLTIDVQATQNA